MKSKRLLKIMSLALLSTSIIIMAPINANAVWTQNSTGWWYTENNSWATGWRYINGVWYLFDESGYMKTGWVNDNGIWYYLNSSGAMATGWINDNGVWYFLKQSGEMASNEIIEYKGDKYYLEASGAMAIGWKSIDNNKYYFNQNGDAAKGIKEIGDSKYYFSSNTSILMKNATVGDITTDGDGKITDKLQIGWHSVSLTKKYYIDADGSRHIGWIEDGDKKYYTGDDGIVVDGVHKIDGELYYFNTYGELDMTPGWKKYNIIFLGVSPKAYINEDGTFAKGWKTIDGKKYYFDEDGASAQGVSDIKLNDEEYYFDCYSSELVSNANYYGIITDENGKIKKLNVDLAKNDILKNDSEIFKKLQEDCDDISLEYFKVKNMKDIYKITSDIQNVGDGEDYSYKEDGDVFVFRCKSNKRHETYANYYVSVKTGNIYVDYFEGDIYKVKDNKQVEKYGVYHKCIAM